MKARFSFCMIPHPEKAAKGGEDAFFASKDKKVFGVFDGVGGWADHGVDPGKYSKQLALETWKAYEKSEEKGKINLQAYLSKGLEASKDTVGSSTACLIGLEGNTFKSATVGDSCFLLCHKDGTLVARQEEMQIQFNMPFQMGTHCTHTAEDAVCGSVELKDGDFVVLGTDGLFDNVFDERIIEICLSGGNEKEIAEALAKEASKNGHDDSFISPFSAKASAMFGKNYRGGKLDDVTVMFGVFESKVRSKL